MSSAAVAWALASAVALTACGYRFTAGGAAFPQGVRTVYVPVMHNRSAEPGVEVAFTEALRLSLLKQGRGGGAGADARIEGELVALSAAPTLLTTAGSLASYRVNAQVRLRLLRGDQLLAETIVHGSEEYLPGRGFVDGGVPLEGEVLEAEANRQSALRRLAEGMMRDAVERFSSGF